MDKPFRVEGSDRPSRRLDADKSESMLPKIEEKILKFWKDRDIFQKTLKNRADAKRFVFYEGPPTANNHPAMHHLIGRVYKDVFNRYKTMHGYLVERKAGWDTHGLPVELEVEKALGLKNKKDIEQYGIAQFNAKAKESVWKYVNEWQEFTERIGFWIDLDHPYITYDPKYVESLWWVISEINKKKLLYEGHKVLPWCTRCGTALSSHEVAQGYADVTDTSVYVKFKLIPGQKFGEYITGESAYILSWTTTPWTLPGNLALAVNKDTVYSAVRIDGIHELLILAKDLIEKVLSGHNLEIVHDDIKGKDLIGLKYEPLFDVPKLHSDKSYQVYHADFVTTTDGTGVVHTAVMYGEDDYELGKKIGLPTVHTVSENGRFNANVREFTDQYVKDPQTEKAIIYYLESKNLLFKTEPYTHSYPFCWRCKTPLLYYAKDSWFVAMSKLRKQLIKNNSNVNWVPEHLRDGRFGEFIKEAKDWAFSRERYWGTPLPAWKCTECSAHRIVGSFAELENLRYEPKNVFVLIRHGHSTKNPGNGRKLELVSSMLEQDKYGLTEEGVTQVEKQAETLKKNGGADLIVASPFLRTQKTAEIIAGKLGIKVHTDKRLRELGHGLECEGKPNDSCPYIHVGRTMDNKKHVDGETWREVKKRMFEVIRELNDKNTGKRILIVSHGDPLWILECALLGFNDTETIKARNSKMFLNYGDIHEIDYKNWPYDERGDVNPHRPYVDDIILKCEKCGGKSKRVKEVVDVWFDSGAMPFAQWHYPFENKKIFDRNFPADFISEAIDQTRGWFYTMLSVSTILGKGMPYKNVVCYSHMVDAQGRKMSKSIGNIIDPIKAINEYGVDTIRWWFYSVNNVGDVKSMSLPVSLKQSKAFVGTLLNSLNFFELYNKPSGRHVQPKAKPVKAIDHWILSRFNSVVAEVTRSLNDYDPTTASRTIESFVVNDLSNWWIRRSRELFQRPEDKKSFQNTIHFLQYLLIELSKLTAPFMPFLSDHIYKRLGSFKESVHLENWPKAKKKLIDLELERQMVEVREMIAEGLAQRKNGNIKVRQPLASITLKKGERFNTDLEELIRAELNIKQIIYNAASIEKVLLDTNLTQELMLEGYARELMRQIQDMRKEAGYKVDDKVFLSWQSENADLISACEKFSDDIMKTALLKEFSRGNNEKLVNDLEKEVDLAPQVKVWLGIRK